ncbi:MAG: DeoR/GlpR transcriptional regulator [Chloroflexi bacterium]|nr:DeoR/GlpR transcriptional regulator [Chloroflexota bacterium]
MTRRLFRPERLEAISQEVQEAGYASVAGLSRRLGVSEVTVRSDLDALEHAGVLVRAHGGAVSARGGDSALSFAVRQRLHVREKERIAALAAELVGDGDSIVLDASTTSWHLARLITGHRDLTVLTTGLYVALELLHSPGISVIMPGGRLWREAASLVGTWSSEILAQGNLRMAFIGGRGLTLEQGLTDANPDEVALKRKLAALVSTVNVLVDGSKLGKVAFAPCLAVSEMHRVVTDDTAAPELVAALRDRGVEVLVA